VIVAPLRAQWPSPRFACAAMDGIAITASLADAAGAGGGARWRLPAGSFTWVDTGQLMPGGTDTVVERERVRATAGGGAEIAGPAPRGRHVRTVGEDFPAGQELLPAGHRLRPADLAVAAAAGHVTLAVARQPAVAIIPTGDEIRPVGTPLGPGDVVDSNSLMLAACVTEAGALPVVSDVQPDDEDAISAVVLRAAAAAGLVLILSGSSAGNRDHTAAVIRRSGMLTVRGVAVRPGHPVLLGHIRRPGPDRVAVPVIGVPGYPLAAAVIFELFAKPLLAALQGTRPPDYAARQARLASDWVSSPEVEDWVPVSLAGDPAGRSAASQLLATPGRRGAAAISRLVHADAWWPIPIGQGNFAIGDLIEVRTLPGVPGSEHWGIGHPPAG
jgi:putative molybdopterin biosynthesis protein